MEENNMIEETGAVRISDDVVQIIAGMAAGEIEGVFAMGNSIAGGIADFLGGKKNVSRGVKVDIQGQDTVIDIHVVVQYGVRIPDVAWGIQEKVKEAVENMTGLTVVKVNIHIDGINIEKEPKAEAAEPETEEE